MFPPLSIEIANQIAWVDIFSAEKPIKKRRAVAKRCFCLSPEIPEIHMARRLLPDEGNWIIFKNVNMTRRRIRKSRYTSAEYLTVTLSMRSCSRIVSFIMKRLHERNQV